MGILKWSGNKIKGLDLYSSKINLTYRGKESFKTLYGGIISSIILFIIIGFGLQLLLIMFTRGETSKSISTSIHNIHTNPVDYDVNKDTFGFSFVFQLIR